MHIYFPYTGALMPREMMEDTLSELEMAAIISLGKRPRLRVAAPNRAGIPHWDFQVNLRPIGDKYRNFGFPRVQGKTGRRKNSVCWHGHRDFLGKLFKLYDDATVRTSVIQYNGIGDFLNKYPNTRENDWSRQSQCQCAYRNLL